jgi:AcrR family transcriptional regulator
MQANAAGKTAKQLFGPDKPATTTRDRIVETALNLFYGYGFHAVGIDQIIAEVGVTKTTFYNHFESKDDLAIAALKLRDQWEAHAFNRMVKQIAGDDPRKQLLAPFDVYHQWFTHPDYTGCMFIKACAEFPMIHDPVHSAAAEAVRVAEQWLADTARRANAADPVALAAKLVLLLEGALTRRMISGDNLSAMHAREVAETILEEHLAG